MDFSWWLGLAGGIILTLAYLPQLKKMWSVRHKPFEEISPLWFAFGLTGSVIMFFYGILIEQPGLLLLNGTVMFFHLFMLILYQNAKIKEKVEVE